MIDYIVSICTNICGFLEGRFFFIVQNASSVFKANNNIYLNIHSYTHRQIEKFDRQTDTFHTSNPIYASLNLSLLLFAFSQNQ